MLSALCFCTIRVRCGNAQRWAVHATFLSPVMQNAIAQASARLFAALHKVSEKPLTSANQHRSDQSQEVQKPKQKLTLP